LAQSYLIQFSIDCDKKFLNWLRTSCVVSMIIPVTWHTWKADFWADFEQCYHQQGNKRVAKRYWYSNSVRP